MTYILRPKQAEAVDAGVALLTSGRRKNGMIVLPTGYGKSLCIAQTVLALDVPATVLQPSKEILEQNEAKFISYGYRPSVFSASVGRREVGDITLATIGSIKDHAALFRGTVLIMDECHGFNPKSGLYRQFYNDLGQPPLLGFTASPYRLVSEGDGQILKFLTRTRPKVFDELTYYVQNREAIEDEHLSPLTYKQWLAIDETKLKLNKAKSDYTDESVQAHLLDIGFADKLERTVKRVFEYGRKHVLVFTRNIAEARALAATIPDCAVVTGDTPKRERERILREFKAGTIKVVCNVAVLIVGFDFPELDCVILANPSMSLSRFYQMCGRGLRRAEGKADCLIVDMVGLVAKFGKIEDLELRNSGAGKWAIWSGTRQLTNKHFGQARNRCPSCQWLIFWKPHEESKKPCMLQKAAFGAKPNITLHVNGLGQEVYHVIPKAEMEQGAEGEFIMHRRVCEQARAYNQPEENQ